MARKKKSQEEPEAIVHTRALLIKQAEELHKLLRRQRLELASTERACKAVADALNGLRVYHGSVVQPKASRDTKKKSRTKNPRYTVKLREDVMRATARHFYKTGKPYTAAQVLEHLTKDLAPIYRGADYQLVWYCIDHLVKKGNLERVEKGTYQWKEGVLPVVAKTSRKKAKTKKKAQPKKGTAKKSRPMWRDEADKLLALHTYMSAAQIHDLLRAKKKPSPSAISKYLRRQAAEGNLKCVKRGYYATVD